MDIKNKFECVFNGDGVTVQQAIDKSMTFIESLTELEKLRAEKVQVETQVKNIEDAIATNKMEKDLKVSKDNLVMIEDLEKKWSEALFEQTEKLKDEIKVKIKYEKTKQRYDPKLKMQDKLAKISQILGPIIEEFKLDFKMPIVQELRRDFDTI